MCHSAFHAIEDLIEYLLAGENSRDGHVSARQRFGKKNHIRFNIPVLDREKTASAADAGLNFVRDKQGSMSPAELSRAFEIIVGRHIDALALDRLDNKGRDRPRMERPLEPDKVVEGDANAAGQQRPETAAKYVVAIEG